MSYAQKSRVLSFGPQNIAFFDWLKTNMFWANGAVPLNGTGGVSRGVRYTANMATTPNLAFLADDEPDRPKRSRQSELGQFFTPVRVAEFMAAMFDNPGADVHLLDAGAGEGSLTAAFAGTWAVGRSIAAEMFEVDEAVLPRLTETSDKLREAGISVELQHRDFLEAASEAIRSASPKYYTHAILNPPYRKIAAQSRDRMFASSVGLETVNLYTAFVGLALELLKPGGEVVAIIPRSFCNGPYYRPFRHWLLERAAIRRIHLFHSRRDAFADADVLQENVIIHLARGAAPKAEVIVSTSNGASFDDLQVRHWPIEAIVRPDDPSQVIYIPLSEEDQTESPFRSTLSSLGLGVATGPVVSFRLRQHLRDSLTDSAVPLLYPQHLKSGRVSWPLDGKKKPNAIELNAGTQKWMFPRGWYVLVKRFSSKEERRRVVASLCDPTNLPGIALGFENKINVVHQQRGSMGEGLARGLTIFLNSTMLDSAFRVFSGHTQVNATDLRGLSFPSKEALIELGKRWTGGSDLPEQQVIDGWVEDLACATGDRL